MTADQFIALATGNGGSVVILIGGIVTAYRYLINHHIPATDRRWSAMMESHEEDRSAFRDALATLSGRVDAVHADVKDIKERITK
tara:strand:- start:3253 stop:3507 length:255 start_codon:yes stop_codon:yes gene_type:complete